MEQTRKEELTQLCAGLDERAQKLSAELITELCFIEERLAVLRSYPHIRVHPSDPARQKVTPAGRQYKEMLQQYLNTIKTFDKLLGSSESEEISPLREYLNSLRDAE